MAHKLIPIYFKVRLTQCGLILALSLGLILSHSATAASDSRAELSAVKKAILAVKKELAQDKSYKAKTERQLQRIEQTIGQTSNNIRQIDRKIAALTAELAELNKRLDKLEQDKQAQQDKILTYIRSAYETSQQNALQLLLNQEKPEDITRLLQYHQHINQARQKKIEAYRTTISELNSLKPTIESTQAKLAKEKQSLETKHQAQLKLKTERKAVISQLNSTIKTHDQQLAQLNADRQRLSQLIKKLEAAIAKLKKPSGFQTHRSQGAKPWPLKGKIVNRFGAWRQRQNMKWQGIFIAAGEGTPVKAIHRGQVIFADWLRGHGLLIIVDHGDDYLSLYAHNQSLSKSTGDWVDTQEIIAAAGNSGGQTRSGLYFEIRHKGQPINPLQWCCR